MIKQGPYCEEGCPGITGSGDLYYCSIFKGCGTDSNLYEGPDEGFIIRCEACLKAEREREQVSRKYGKSSKKGPKNKA